MSSNSNQFQSPYLITSRKFPQEPSELESTLTKSYFDIASNVNISTNGIYERIQVDTRNKYYTTSINFDKKRQSYRQIYPFGAIAAGAPVFLIAHGITGITQIVNMYGDCVTDASVITTAKYEPIPFVSVVNTNQQISLWMDDTNIYITNGSGNNNILSGTIVVEYLLD